MGGSRRGRFSFEGVLYFVWKVEVGIGKGWGWEEGRNKDFWEIRVIGGRGFLCSVASGLEFCFWGCWGIILGGSESIYLMLDYFGRFFEFCFIWVNV